jgi:hypothetical protein
MRADICSKFSNAEWDILSEKLERNEEGSWTEAISVFERRMRERFLRGIDALFAADTKPDLPSSNSIRTDDCVPGFAIMALCCLFIEALQGFLDPPAPAPNPMGPCYFPSGNCIKPSSGTNQQFKKFLCRPAFGGAFEGKLAGEFTSGIRNGILHEAETRKWVIWREEPEGKIAVEVEDG